MATATTVDQGFPPIKNPKQEERPIKTLRERYVSLSVFTAAHDAY